MVYRWIYNRPDGWDDLYMSSDGEYLTGYGGGIRNKEALLNHEKISTEKEQ